LQYFILVGALLLVLLTGLSLIILSVRTLVKNHNFVHDFRETFGPFASSYLQQASSSIFSPQVSQPQLDGQQYHWLVSQMDKTQRLLGTFGIAYYTGPFNRVQIPNYYYIINTIPQIRSGHADRADILTCDDMMVRYLGSMTRSIEEEKSKAKNPFIWLQQGIQFYIAFPVRLLNWFGIISDSSLSKITSSQLFKVLSGIGGLAAFLASIIQIFQAWPFVLGFF
jgi:hypothetical protein